MKSITEIMLAVREYRHLFYHKDTNTIDYKPASEQELKHLDPNQRIPMGDGNSVMLPSYEEINHKEIMRFYVREFVEDKEIRKRLFGILRRREFMDEYLQALHELNLYDDFEDACGDIYFQIFEEWSDAHNLGLVKRN